MLMSNLLPIASKESTTCIETKSIFNLNLDHLNQKQIQTCKGHNSPQAYASDVFRALRFDRTYASKLNKISNSNISGKHRCVSIICFTC